jgi:hypothetical protein
VIQAAAGFSTLLLIAIGWVIGLRLLLLARRTRGIPELTIGLGVLLIGGFAYPLAATAQALFDSHPLAARICVILSGTLAHAGVASHSVFTWKVFRPSALWARAWVGLCVAAVAVGCAGQIQMALADTPWDSETAQNWTLFLMFFATLVFTWSGVESLHYYAMLRRRLALGMSDPVVTNRFLLWGISGVASSLSCVVNAVFVATSPLSTLDPVALVVSGSVSLLSAVVMTLTFLPPARYLRFITARHAATR